MSGQIRLANRMIYVHDLVKYAKQHEQDYGIVQIKPFFRQYFNARIGGSDSNKVGEILDQHKIKRFRRSAEKPAKKDQANGRAVFLSTFTDASMDMIFGGNQS